MGSVRRYEDLIAWRLSADLRDRIHQHSAGWQDWNFRDQMRDASASAPRNLAEGFGLFSPRGFARHARIARGSLAETRNHIQDAAGRGLVSATEAADLVRLAARASGAVTGLLKYLVSCDGRAPTGWSQADGPHPRRRS